MKPGETYFVKGHLWVVLCLPTAGGEFAMANLTSHRHPCDESCVLDRGDHPFIQHKTVVRYGSAVWIPVSAYDELKKLDSWPDVTGSVLDRILQGALASGASSQKVKNAVAATLTKIAKK